MGDNSGPNCCLRTLCFCSVFICLGIGANIGYKTMTTLKEAYVSATEDDYVFEYVGLEEIRHAVCVFNTTAITGTVCLTQLGPNPGSDLHLQTNITGIPAGPHGFHIHQWGAPANGDCAKCGGHYNPAGNKHGGPQDDERHVGDLGNLIASDGITAVNINNSLPSLWGNDSIIGRSLVIHEGEDDLGTKSDIGSQTSGNAGKPLACCTIYLIEA